MLGAISTQQFQRRASASSSFRKQKFANTTVNFADLLNLFVFRPDLNIGATIKAMQERNLLQILAEPNLITLEGKEASFLAGGSFPFPTLTTTSTGGAVSPVITVQFKPFGMQLVFTPTVTPSGAINLKVAPEVSALDFANAVTLQGFLIPALIAARAETEVILKDGESFAIAGLIDNRVIQAVNKVPGLGDIPILGNCSAAVRTRKIDRRAAGGDHAAFRAAAQPGREGEAAGFSETFLPSVAEEKAKKGDKKQAEKTDEEGGVCRTSWIPGTQVARRRRGASARAARRGTVSLQLLVLLVPGDLRLHGVRVRPGTAVLDPGRIEPGGERHGAGGGLEADRDADSTDKAIAAAQVPLETATGHGHKYNFAGNCDRPDHRLAVEPGARSEFLRHRRRRHRNRRSRAQARWRPRPASPR